MGEPGVEGGPGKAAASRGLRPARVVKILLVVFVLSAAALVTVAALTPEPQALRVDYGGFD